jgi:predicted transcriptional regulator
MGYKSWSSLAHQTYQTLTARGYKIDSASYERYLERNMYPELFRQAELDMGGRENLIALIKQILFSMTKQTGSIYQVLTKWPFACYLTTNYDDEILAHLKTIGFHFETLRNREKDFYPIRDGASNYILKLHSDLNHPAEVILTSSDYFRLESEPSSHYFREKLQMIFHMFDVVIVGHSLNDPDIALILKQAKVIADRNRPIFMIAADFTKADEREYSEKYNIELISYENDDGTHSQLGRLLNSANKWIISRQSYLKKPEFKRPLETEIAIASSLYLFRKLKELGSNEYLAPLVLATLEDAGPTILSIDDILNRTESIMGKNLDIDSIQSQLDQLLKAGFIDVKGDKYIITQEGSKKVSEVRRIRESETGQSYGQFLVELKRLYSPLTKKEEETCRDFAETTIVDAFTKRGMTIANKVFAKQSANPDELSDVFEIVSQIASKIEPPTLASAFVEAMYQFLITPNDPQKNYLASLSQGYFLFHFLGLDPKLTRLRLDLFQETVWLCDSSILLPLAAINCYNNEYAKELFHLLQEAKTKCVTTTNLIEEAWNHFDWAIRFVRACGVDSPEFLRAALVKGSYKQNLFIDGYIRSVADGIVGTFNEYLNIVAPSGLDRNFLENILKDYGIELILLNKVKGFSDEDWAELEEAKANIKKERETRGTFRSDLQVTAEGEVWLLLKNLRSGKYSFNDSSIKLTEIYFISQSRSLDRAFMGNKVITWTPEAVYRYLASLPNAEIQPDLLQQCMTNEYFYAGISFIDEKRYLRYFGPSVEQSKISFETEKGKYLANVESDNRSLDQLTKEFDSIPDLEKPFFMSQMGWRLAQILQGRVDSGNKRAFEAEQQIKLMASKKISKKELKAAEREESARLKHLSDPKYLAKKLHQAKKRKKNKKR